MTVGQALTQNAQALRQLLEVQQCLLELAVRGGELTEMLEVCIACDCPHRRMLRETLSEVIRVLEQTRKAFKSKQLEELRIRLIGVLAQDD